MLREARPRRIIGGGAGLQLGGDVGFERPRAGWRRELYVYRSGHGAVEAAVAGGRCGAGDAHRKKVQDAPLEAFAALGENDVLFIDSSHVSKIGSDVNRLFFDVLPSLAPGGLIHIHDVAGNLDYPREWPEEGRAWNEPCLLRAFLMNTTAYRLELFSAWLWNQRHDLLRARMPMCGRGGGGQMWLRKMTR